MMMRFTSSLILLLLVQLAYGQLNVDSTISPQAMIQEVLLGEGVTVSNITYTGDSRGAGAFRNDSTLLPFSRGIVLSTGYAAQSGNPNASPATSGDFTRVGSNILSALSKGKTYDAALLSFDFVPEQTYTSFHFVFASEEYTEYVGQEFNDVFGFLVEGGDLKGMKNIALVPGTQMPVTVDNINPYRNSEWYIDNNLWDNHNVPIKGKADDLFDPARPYHFSFDGLTKVLIAKCKLTPGLKYRLTIAIADVGDRSWDSAVFLEGGSFSSGQTVPTVTATNDPVETETEPEAVVSVIEPPEVMGAKTVNFEHDSYHLTLSEKEKLAEVAEWMLGTPDYNLVIEGHTDSDGEPEYNQRLSQKRAEAVENHLQKLGVSKARLSVDAFSESKPVATNDTDEGKAKNRRVEILPTAAKNP